jgi:hypothetical protein
MVHRLYLCSVPYRFASVPSRVVHSVLIKALFMLAVLASVAFAQMESATVLGRITDPSGAVLVGAEVDARNIDTNITAAATTNKEGFYRINSLRPGRYVISAHKPGFKSVSVTDISLNVQDNLVRNFALQVGAVSESLTVTAKSAEINTSDGSVSTVVDRRFVENTPLNGRSFQDLISMTPGVVTQNPNASNGSQGQGGDFSVNGQRTEGNYYTVDGVSANVSAGAGFGSFVGANNAASGSLSAGTVLGTTQSLVSVDALQEFRVQSSTYSAEYGRMPGAQVSLVTRSGTNTLHGSLFDYLRNDFFDANDWFNDHLGKSVSALRQNDFGGTLGGPIYIPHVYRGKDKTFFFFSYEGLRLVQPQAASTAQLVPDIFMRQQAPATLQPLLNAFPVPNGKDFGTAAAPSLAQFIQPFSVPSNIDSTSIRVDHTVGPRLSLFFRFADTPTHAQTRGTSGSASVLTTTSFNTQTYTLGAISELSARSNNDFRLGYAMSEARVRSALDDFGDATPIDLTAAVGASAAGSPSPTLVISIPGVGLSVLRVNNSGNRIRQWNLVDTMSFVLGGHQLKLGFDYRRSVSPNRPSSPLIQAVYAGVLPVLAGQSSITLVQNNVGATPIFNETAAFVEDEWRVRSNLNLSLGLRWEVDPPPYGSDGKDAYTLSGSISNPTSLTLAPRGTPLWRTTWYNFAPRLGAAWTARKHPGYETVVRGGGGVFFDTGQQTAAEGFSGLGFSAFGLFPGASFPLTPAQLNLTPSVAPPFNSNVYLFPQHLQLPYTLQWNLTVEQAIGSKQALRVSYVGSAARRLSGQQALSLAKFNPNFAGNRLIYWTSGLTSDYDALQTAYQSSLSHGVHGLLSYTWSHCIDFGSSYSSTSTASGINQTAFLRGNCDTDVRHNVQGGVSWDLPQVSGNGILQALANHWGLDGRLIARTGFPIPLNGNFSIDSATGSTFATGLNLVPNQPIYLYGSQFPGGRSIDPAAFELPASGILGNAPRNFARGFGSWQINMAVRREFPLEGGLHLQFRAEAFNILNHPNFGAIDSSLTSGTFGQAISMLNQSLTTVASQYQQGGPRSIQFALKLAF